MFKVILLPLAKEDIKSSANWYDEQQKGLGKKFTAQIRKEIQFVLQNPIAIETRYDEVKTCVVKNFPFMIHYYVDVENKEIIISAIFHTSLNPKKWKKRK